MKRPTKKKPLPAPTDTTKYPWRVLILPLVPRANVPIPVESTMKAKDVLLKKLDQFERDMKVYDKDGTERCVAALRAQVQALPMYQGGEVDGVLDERTGLRFRAVIERTA